MTATIIPFPQRPGAPRPVEPALRDRLERIEQLVDEFACDLLDRPWSDLCETLFEEVASHAPQTFARGREAIWAGAIVHCIAQHNRLFHVYSPSHIQASVLAERAGCSMPSISARSKQLRDLVGIGRSPDANATFRRSPLDAMMASYSESEWLMEAMPSPHATLAERRAVADQLRVELEQLAEPADPTRQEICKTLHSVVAAMDAALEDPALTHDQVDATCQLAAPAMDRVNRYLFTTSARRALGAERMLALGESAAIVAELSGAAFDEELGPIDVEALAPSFVPDRLPLLHALMRATADGLLWARRTKVRPDAKLAGRLTLEIEESLAVMSMYESQASGLASPLALAAYDIVDTIAMQWVERLQRGERGLYVPARDRIRSAVSTQLEQELSRGVTLEREPDLEEAIDLGVGLALVEQVVHEHADQASRPRVHAADICRWHDLLTGRHDVSW